jgi:MraZ protein
LFLGKHFRGLDHDHRFLTPDGYKKNLDDEVYIITQGFDHNLWVFSSEAFQEIYKKLANLNIADPLARLLFRLILGAATEAGLSDQGYLEIPDGLRGFAGIENEVLLVGQGDYFEIWSPELWNKQEVELRKAESNTERFSTFELTTR